MVVAADCRKFAYQVLVCLRFLRAQKVLHCDLKPENILLKENGRSGIKVRSSKQDSCVQTKHGFTPNTSKSYVLLSTQCDREL